MQNLNDKQCKKVEEIGNISKRMSYGNELNVYLHT